jgi:hypothetical protein
MPRLKLLSVLTAAAIIAAIPALAAPAMKTETRKVSSLPGIGGYYKLAPAEKSQFAIFYAVKIKHASLTDATAFIDDNGRHIPIRFGANGRIEPMPTREQVTNGATLSVTYPADANVAMKVRVYSTQSLGHTYDAAGLAIGVKQANKAMAKIGGLLVAALPRLDRVYFIGAGSGTFEADGKSYVLPVFKGDNEVPPGTPYFVPAQYPAATKIHLSNVPSNAFFATAPD